MITATRTPASASSRRGAALRNGRRPRGAVRPGRRGTFDRSTPAFAHMNPWRVSEMIEFAAAAEHPHRLAPDQCFFGLRVVGIDLDDAALGLRDDLLGDDDDVAVEQCRQRSAIIAARSAERVTSPIPWTGRTSSPAGAVGEAARLRSGRVCDSLGQPGLRRARGSQGRRPLRAIGHDRRRHHATHAGALDLVCQKTRRPRR